MMSGAPSSAVNATPIRPHPPASANQSYGTASSPDSDHPAKKHKPFVDPIDSTSSYPAATGMTQAYTPTSYGQPGAQASHTSPYAPNAQQPGPYSQPYSQPQYGATTNSQYPNYPSHNNYASYTVPSMNQSYQQGLPQQYQFTQNPYANQATQATQATQASQATQYAGSPYSSQGQYPSQYQRGSHTYFGQTGTAPRPTGAIANPSSTPTLPPMRVRCPNHLQYCIELTQSVEHTQAARGQSERDEQQ